jgi:disulfide bond formation protein DsbB
MIPSLIFYTQTINLFYALAGLVVLVITLLLIYDLRFSDQKLFKEYVQPYVSWIIMITSIGGAMTTLLYSEVLGFIPCSLCWLQRAALYPQAILSVVAFRLKEWVFFPVYGIVLSSFGLLVATYQYIYQALPEETLASGLVPCLADGSADCSKTVMEVFGFVTFPFLSGVMFLFLIVLYSHLRKIKQ